MVEDINKKQFSIGDILSRAMDIFTSEFKTILIVTLIIFVPIKYIMTFFPIGEDLTRFIKWWRVYMILNGLLGIIATMAIAYIVKRKIDGKPISYKEAFGKAFSRWAQAIGTNIMQGLFLMGLFLLLIVPGIIFGVYWTFVLFVVVLSDRSGKAALDYSKRVVKGRWGTVFGYSLVFSLLSTVAVGIAGFTFGIVLYLIPGNMAEVISDSLIDIIISYFTVVTAVFYINFEATMEPEVEKTVIKDQPKGQQELSSRGKASDKKFA